MAVGSLKFSWEIKNFSKLNAEILSEVFSLGPYKWKINVFPKGCHEDTHLSILLEVADSETLPSGWSRNVRFSCTLIDRIYKKSYCSHGGGCEFDEEKTRWGWPSFILLKELFDPKNGFLVKDSCIIEAEVTICEDTLVESSRKEPTEEEVNAFFGDLNYVVFPMKVVSWEEEAKQALEMIEEALNMAPEDLNNQGRMLQLKNSLDVLTSLDDGSILTSEQKEKLLSMKDNFIDLPGRASNAVKGIQRFTEKEIVKKALDQKLAISLIGFEKVKAETAQNEQDIATLLAQIGEMEKKKDNLLLKQKEMFKLSKESKEELDKLVKNWPDYEAEMKAAEKEKKVVGREWSKMKQFVSSLKPQSTLAKKPVKRKISTRSSRLKSVFLEKKFYLRKKQRICRH